MGFDTLAMCLLAAEGDVSGRAADPAATEAQAWGTVAVCLRYCLERSGSPRRR
jgi:hypothetical protein